MAYIYLKHSIVRFQFFQKKQFTNRINKSKKEIIQEYNNIKPKVFYRNNLRHIEPYSFVYQSYIKERWIGKTIIEVLSTEFKKKDESEYKSKINSGQIKVNNSSIDIDYIFKNNDFLTEEATRRENPIIEIKQLQIIYEDEDYVVVNKPSSWPVQGCSGYQYNTLLRIMKDDYNYKELKTVHRIDKDTSGVVIMAKTDFGVELFSKCMNMRKIDKTYLCRVRGNFKYENLNLIKDISSLSKNEFSRQENTKSAETHFVKLFYDDDTNTTVVKAKPITGRTHQIRIHLQYLEYPIANDPWYGGIIYNDLSKCDFSDAIISNTYCFKIWLHSLSYSYDKYKFSSDYPIWANKEYKIDIKF